MVVGKFESRVDVGWYNRTGKKVWLCLVIARETRCDIARVNVSVETMIGLVWLIGKRHFA